MINFPKIILFCLILCAAFSGCSNTSITNNSIPEAQNEPVIKSFEAAMVSLDKIPSIKLGTRIEIDWPFYYIRYNGESYVISSYGEVKKNKLGKQIGTVKRSLPSSMVVSGGRFIDMNGDSNYLAVGSSIYAFKGKNTNEAIIVEKNGVFKEAIPYRIWSFYSLLRNKNKNFPGCRYIIPELFNKNL